MDEWRRCQRARGVNGRMVSVRAWSDKRTDKYRSAPNSHKHSTLQQNKHRGAQCLLPRIGRLRRLVGATDTDA